jgi:hypothetical protein
MFLFFALFAACKPESQSNIQGLTGRLGMNDTDGFQCYNLKYSGTEKVNGIWIAGVDGTTFGSMKDGAITPICGKTFTVKSKKTGASEQFIVVDRIWENDGVNGKTYNPRDKAGADAKVRPTGNGYFQIDIAKRPFQSMFGGHNPGDGDIEIIGLAGAGGGSVTSADQSKTSGSAGSGTSGAGDGSSFESYSPEGSSGSESTSGTVGEYTCEQQKAWGKCGESWMKGVCDHVCNTGWGSAPMPAPTGGGMPAGGGSIGGYSCEQQKAWGKCGESWMRGVCDHVCNSGSGANPASSWSSGGGSSGSGGGDYPSCPGNSFCNSGWGWLNPGENGCQAGSGGWKGNGCSCRC